MRRRRSKNIFTLLYTWVNRSASTFYSHLFCQKISLTNSLTYSVSEAVMACTCHVMPCPSYEWTQVIHHNHIPNLPSSFLLDHVFFCAVIILVSTTCINTIDYYYCVILQLLRSYWKFLRDILCISLHAARRVVASLPTCHQARIFYCW